MRIGMVTKQMFFDSKAVIGAVDRATRKVFSRFGAFVRTAAKHSIRKRKAVSQPGQPPSSHAGHLRRLIFFGYESARKSVVIGPTPLRGTAEAPPLLEYGGSGFASLRRDELGLPRRSRRRRRATYRPRPFMGPAFEQEKPKLPAMWANSVK